MKNIYPKKLQKGDTVVVIAPSASMHIIKKKTIKNAVKSLENLGLFVKYAKHVNEIDEFKSSSIKSRIDDIHEAFRDKEVKAIIAVIGGFNCNQLLRGLDWNLIKNNPKIVCGFSDITALNNAMYAKTGLITYHGPCFFTFGQKCCTQYTIDYFKKCLMSEPPYFLKPAKTWFSDEWYESQEDKYLIPNQGYWVLTEGAFKGTIVGGNLSTFNLLQGTEYMSSLINSILFIEDNYESLPNHFNRDLQSLIQQPGFSSVQGIMIGRFLKVSKIDRNLLEKIIKSKKELDNMPIIANVDFGHTDPKITFPIGGFCEIFASDKKIEIKITKH